MTRPPRRSFLVRIAALLLGPAHDPLLGDLEEVWLSLREDHGSFAAGRWLVFHLVGAVPSILIHDYTIGNNMLKNYFRVGLRQMRNNPGFSVINVFGLALSMSICLLIVTLVTEQNSVDEFHPSADRTYRFTTTLSASYGTYPMATSSSSLGPEIARRSPLVEDVVRLRKVRGSLQRENGTIVSFRGLYAEPSFFDIFQFSLATGNSNSALTEPHSIILGAELARSLFGDEDPLGQTVIRSDSEPLTVTAVLEPIRNRTHFRFDALISLSTLPSIASGQEVWDDFSLYYNYFVLAKGANPESIQHMANELSSRGETEETTIEIGLQPLTEINMGHDLSNQIAPVLPSGFFLVLSLFATVMLTITAFNYVTLSVSRAERRVREIGIRKAIGATRSALLKQFLVETSLMVTGSLVLGFILLYWLIPLFNSLGAIREQGADIRLSMFNFLLVARFIGFGGILALVLGIVPALRLSGTSAVGLTGGFRMGRRRGVRKGVVVTQFAVSMVAIAVTIILFRQSGFLLNADYGFDEEQLVNIELKGVEYEQIRPALLELPGVIEVTASNTPPGAGSTWNTDIRIPGMDESSIIQKFSVDDHFLDLYRIDVLAGRGFSPEYPSDPGSSVLINESAVQFLGLNNPADAVGMRLAFDQNLYDDEVTVVGVVKDFYTSDFGDGYRPAVLGKRPESWLVATARVHPDRITATLKGVDDVWARLAPGIPATWIFFDDQLKAGYADLRDAVRLSGMFAFFILVVAVLGLLGMATFTAESRRAEVGVRKVLGAGVGQVVGLLSQEYLVLMGLAVCIAIPVVTIVGNRLLERFANHIDVGLGIFLLGVLPVVGLAFSVIATQTVKAALTNPVDVIRNE